MDIDRFRQEVHATFGEKMEHATPAHMRKFLCRVYAELDESGQEPRPAAVVRDEASNYEQIVTEFFARVLDLPPERGVVLLWLFATEMFYSRLGEQYAELTDLMSFDIPG